jgi:hypothetical protein
LFQRLDSNRESQITGADAFGTQVGASLVLDIAAVWNFPREPGTRAAGGLTRLTIHDFSDPFF